MTVPDKANNKRNYPTEFGPLKYLTGLNGGRFPNDNAVFIDDDIKAVIDPGSNPEILKTINERNNIEYVFNSHYHYDHIRYNHIFENSKILLPELDAPVFESLDTIALAIGIPQLYDIETVSQWKRQLEGGPPFFRGMYDVAYGPEWITSTKRVDGSFRDGDVFEFGETTMNVLHTPGHSLGMCCFVFPGLNCAFVTDYDLTPFGPWYGSVHSDMEAIISSAEKLKELKKITWFITAHEEGIFNRDDFMAGLDRFINVIYTRETRILKLIEEKPRSMDELVRSSIVYNSRHVKDKFTYLWEWNHLQKHLERLMRLDKIELEQDKYKLKLK